MGKLTHLQPERVFHYFEEICGIPHGSGDTARISDYCVAFAKAQGLAYHQDALGNVIIKKPATSKCAKASGVHLLYATAV